MKNKIRFFSGATCVLLLSGLALSTIKGEIDQPNIPELPSETIEETVEPTVQTVEEPLLKEEKIPVHRVGVISYQNPETEKAENIFVTPKDSWPSIDMRKQEKELSENFAIFENTLLEPYLDDANTKIKAVVMRYTSLKDPSIHAEFQNVLVINGNDDVTVAQGYYSKVTLFTGPTSVETVEKSIALDGDIVLNFSETTDYDEFGNGIVRTEAMPISEVNLSLLLPEEYVSAEYTIEDYIAFEEIYNAPRIFTKQKDDSK